MFYRIVGVSLALLGGLAPIGVWARQLEIGPALVARATAPSAGGEELIVCYKAHCQAAGRARVERACGALRGRVGYGGAYHILSLAPGRSAAQEAARLRADPSVRFAEPNGLVRTLSLPNDPFFDPYQWNLADTGFGIHVPSAWDRSIGTGVVVAVVDTGIAYENYNGFTQAPDMAETSFVPGWDFVHDTAHADDDNGHGTHVAGTIAESSNNGVGCAGVAPGASLMPIKALGSDGTGPTSALVDSIRFAADHGAQVINVSVGTSQSSQALQDAVQYVHDKGVVIVAAAGNDGTSAPVFPAAYSGVISVGATRYDGQTTYYSNYGPTLSVVAPGGDPKVDQNGDGYPDMILQETFDPAHPGQFGYFFKAGTSQAAPHVSGIAALVLSIHPDFTPDQVADAIEQTATDLGAPGRDDHYGWGLVNAAAAVSFEPSSPTQRITTMLDVNLDASQYNFESGGFQGWNTTDVTHASLLNTTQMAYKGQHSLQVSLKEISIYTPGILRVEPDGGAVIPAGHTVTAYVQPAPGPTNLLARLVLYDNRGQPVVGPFLNPAPGHWTPISVTVPASASGPIRWIYLQFMPRGFGYTGTCYVDTVGW